MKKIATDHKNHFHGIFPQSFIEKFCNQIQETLEIVEQLKGLKVLIDPWE